MFPIKKDGTGNNWGKGQVEGRTLNGTKINWDTREIGISPVPKHRLWLLIEVFTIEWYNNVYIYEGDSTYMSGSNTLCNYPYPIYVSSKLYVGQIASTLLDYERLLSNPGIAPIHWKDSCIGSELSLHQLSPYIGKLKSCIASDLVDKYSKRGDLVIDPFSGSGTIALEAAIKGRRVFVADISPYSKVLSKAKLSAPSSLGRALDRADRVLEYAEKRKNPDLRIVPSWVRKFFNSKTLKEAIKFSLVCQELDENFLLACFLGILHHQRPGFLSYPSSHLVPYLRNKKFPCKNYPELYQYRSLRPRIMAKIKRAYRRFPADISSSSWEFRQSSIQHLSLPNSIDCIITSPPYMNTLNYGRDNRLRLWFLDPCGKRKVDNPVTQSQEVFQSAIVTMAKKIESALKSYKYCIIVVGETALQHKRILLSRIICRIFNDFAPSLRLISLIRDDIPDIRRARKDCRGTKAEHILVFRKI